MHSALRPHKHKDISKVGKWGDIEVNGLLSVLRKSLKVGNQFHSKRMSGLGLGEWSLGWSFHWEDGLLHLSTQNQYFTYLFRCTRFLIDLVSRGLTMIWHFLSWLRWEFWIVWIDFLFSNQSSPLGSDCWRRLSFLWRWFMESLKLAYVFCMNGMLILWIVVVDYKIDVSCIDCLCYSSIRAIFFRVLLNTYIHK